MLDLKNNKRTTSSKTLLHACQDVAHNTDHKQALIKLGKGEAIKTLRELRTKWASERTKHDTLKADEQVWKDHPKDSVCWTWTLKQDWMEKQKGKITASKDKLTTLRNKGKQQRSAIKALIKNALDPSTDQDIIQALLYHVVEDVVTTTSGVLQQVERLIPT